MSIDAVIFDIGNVLIAWQPERFYDAMIGESRRRAMFDAVDLHGMNDAIDRGADFHATVSACAAAHSEWRAEIMMWHDNWLQMVGPECPRVVRLLGALRAAHVPVFALSNFGIQPFAIAQPVYPFLRDFDRRYISGHMGIAKPDAEIYDRVEQDCGIAPGRLLFVDDRAENIAAARARGWRTHHHDTPENLAAALVSAGLLATEAVR